MSLWMPWWNAIWRLRPAFSRLRTFLWFVTAVAGFTVRTELLGVTSLVRALKLEARFYNKLVDHFHSPAVKLDRLAALWTRTVLRLFPQPLRINGRCIVVGDGIKVPKRGRKMPAVKLLHQQSESNTKPEYIMGHSLQAVSLLVQAAASVFAVPLAMRIHEGVVWSNRDRRTLLDKMLALLGIVAIAEPCYFVADAYYAARKIVTGLLKENNHLVTRVKSNAVAYTAHQQRGPRKRGRPRVYGRKVKLSSLLQDPKGRQQAKSPVYGERQVVIQYKVRDLLWRPAGRLVRFVAVIHPTRGSCLLMCTDTSLAAIEIVRLYGLRFKIEHTFKQAVRRLVQLPLLDVRHEAAAPPQPQPAPPSRVARIPRRRQAQAARLPRLHPGGCRLSGTAPVPPRRLPAARLGRFRLLAAHHPARNPALGAGRGQCPAPEETGISLESRRSQHLREIRHRTTGHR